jgi:hypothetical protein
MSEADRLHVRQMGFGKIRHIKGRLWRGARLADAVECGREQAPSADKDTFAPILFPVLTAPSWSRDRDSLLDCGSIAVVLTAR